MKHEDGQFTGCRDAKLYYQCWLPEKEPKTVLLLVHGLADHSGRYSNLVNYFVPRGYAIYAYDQRGHGQSEGMRSYIERFSYLVDDLDIFRRLVSGRHGKLKIFIVGHSVGGTVATTYAIRHQDEFDGLILSSVLLGTPHDVAAGTILVARILSLILPKAGLYYIDAEAISQDKSVVKAYVDDPLAYQGKISARTGVELIKAMDAANRRSPEIHLPILVMHGTADRIADPKSSEVLYQEASSADKTLKLYGGYYHEIFNEPGRELVFADLESWLKAHV